MRRWIKKMRRLFLCIALASCGGTVSGGESMSPPRGAGGATGAGGAGPTGPGVEAAGPLPLRRLTHEEYNNTVRDLIGETGGPADAFDADGVGSAGYDDPGVVDLSDTRAFGDAAQRMATAAVGRLATILPCDPARDGEDACAKQLVRKLGARAYRRPLTDEEAQRLDTVYTTARTQLQGSFADGVRLVLQAMLQSPNFLYHWELAAAPPRPGTTLQPLDGWAVASRLSYFLWRTMPDQALFDAAPAGLATPADVERQVRRMLADARARAGMESFHLQWLGLRDVTSVVRDTKQYPEWSAAAPAAMLAEARAFVDHVALVDGKWSTLMLAPFSFPSAPLAKIYGVAVTGKDPVMTPLPAAERRGILTQAAFLNAYPAGAATHPPVQRGKRIFNRVLCGGLQPPGMVPPLAAPPPGLPLRKHFEAHSTEPVCAACHAILDPPGFAFEHYGSTGKYGPNDATGQPADTAGTVTFPSGRKVMVKDALDLIQQIAAADEAARCFATEMFRFAVGRADAPEDAASIAAAYDAFQRQGGDVRELVVAIARSRAFTSRKPGVGEGL